VSEAAALISRIASLILPGSADASIDFVPNLCHFGVGNGTNLVKCTKTHLSGQPIVALGIKS